MTFELETSDLAHVNLFIAVVEHGNFTAAGQKLGISGSAVGQSIRLFEQRLGIQLFVRTTRAVMLTERGRDFLKNVRPVALAFAEAIGNAKVMGERPMGLVRIHAPRSAVEQVLYAVLPRFSEVYPDIELDITVSDEDVDLIEHGFDVAFKIGELVHPDVVSIQAGPDLRQLALASPAFVTANGRPSHPRDLLKFPCIQWRWTGHLKAYEWEFSEDDRTFHVQVQGPLLLTDRQLILQLCRLGAGIALVGELDARPYLASGELINLLDRWCPSFPGWRLCFHRQRHLARPVRLFVDAVRDAKIPNSAST